jgi:hypothetical protein
MSMFREEQVMLTLAFAAYARFFTLNTSHSDQLIQKDIEKELSTRAPLNGNWQLVWGPATQHVPFTLFSDSLMYIARSTVNPWHYAVVVRGTNPISLTSWLLEDFAVRRQVAWPYADGTPPASSTSIFGSLMERLKGPPSYPRVSLGTAIGLQMLQELVPSDGVPGAQLNIYKFLQQEAARPENARGLTVSVTGHSLGGALTPALALWLAMTRDRSDQPGVAPWDPLKKAKINVYAFAGPSPGNQEFAASYDKDLGELTERLWNQFDVVPHGWEEQQLAQLFTLYEPTLRTGLFMHVLLTVAQWLAQGGNYRQVRAAVQAIEGGEVVSLLRPYLIQAAYQHTGAYLELLDLFPHVDPRDYFDFDAQTHKHIGARMQEHREAGGPVAFTAAEAAPPSPADNAVQMLLSTGKSALKAVVGIPHAVAAHVATPVMLRSLQTRQDHFQRMQA